VTPTNADEKPTSFETLVKWSLLVLAVIVAVAGVARMGAADDVLKRLDGTTLTYLGVAAALLLLRDVKTLAFGDYKLEFERTRKIAAEAKVAAESAQVIAVGTGTGKSLRGPAALHEDRQPGSAENDPWKGVFGGRAESNGRRLTARVWRVTKGSSNPFSIRLRVESTDPATPLTGVVRFFLHDSFRNDRPEVPVGPKGVAELELRGYGAFTVGALADQGATELELDLAELPDAPLEFRSA
jgi:hypothetical protein